MTAITTRVIADMIPLAYSNPLKCLRWLGIHHNGLSICNASRRHVPNFSHKAAYTSHHGMICNAMVYKVPEHVRKLRGVLPQMTTFASKTHEFQRPLVLRADITDVTRSSWLAIDSPKKFKFNSRDETPYLPPALIRWFSGRPNTKFRIPVRLSSYFARAALRHKYRLPMEVIRPPRHVVSQTSASPAKSGPAYGRVAEVNAAATASSTQNTAMANKQAEEKISFEQLYLTSLVDAFSSTWSPPFSIYMAQTPVTQLPPPLQDDIRPPYLLSGAAPCDIYDTNLWIGSEPTYTSLHRDPNPNYLLQLCGNKHVRLLRPEFGEDVYNHIRRSIGGGGGDPNMRGTEMMTGPEKLALEQAIWGNWKPEGLPQSGGSCSTCTGYAQTHQPSHIVLETGDLTPQELSKLEMKDVMWEAVLKPGDALFIPLGWWHSVRSSHADARLNSSVNWWFRYRGDPRIEQSRMHRFQTPRRRINPLKGHRIKRKFLDLSSPTPQFVMTRRDANIRNKAVVTRRLKKDES